MRMGVGGRVGHAAAYLKEDHAIHFKKEFIMAADVMTEGR